MKLMNPKPASARADLLLASTALIALSARADYPPTVLSQGPVGYWRLNDTVPPLVPPVVANNSGTLGAPGTGTIGSSVIRGIPGALASSSTAFQFSNPGWVVTFLGGTVDVPFNAALNPNGSFSIEFWAKPSSAAPDLFAPVASIDASLNAGNSRSGYLVYLDGVSNRWNFRTGGTNGYNGNVNSAVGSATPGVWHHVVGVYSGTTAT